MEPWVPQKLSRVDLYCITNAEIMLPVRVLRRQAELWCAYFNQRDARLAEAEALLRDIERSERLGDIDYINGVVGTDFARIRAFLEGK